MRKYIICILASAVVGNSICGCDVEKYDAFELACEANDGKYKGDKLCECGGEICALGAVCIDGKCPVSAGCKENDYRCVNDANSKGTIQVCRDNTWSVVESCQNNVSCIDRNAFNNKDDALAKCGQCIDGEQDCRNQIIRECIDGNWTETSKKCEVCAPNSTRCEDDLEHKGRLYQCSGDGKDETATACDHNASCKDKLQCGECLNETMVCVNNQDNVGEYRRCQNGVFSESVSCRNEQGESVSCNPDGMDCGECKTGDTRCVDQESAGHIQTCVNGKWESPKTCDDGNSCKDDKACGECINGAIKCTDADDGGKTQLCEHGVWQDNTNRCGRSGDSFEPYSCNENLDGCGICMNHAAYCKNDDTGAGAIVSCKNGQFESQSEKCRNSLSCNASGEGCGECINGEFRLSETKDSSKPNSTKSHVELCSTGGYTNDSEFYIALKCDSNINTESGGLVVYNKLMIYSNHIDNVEKNLHSYVRIYNKESKDVCDAILNTKSDGVMEYEIIPTSNMIIYRDGDAQQTVTMSLKDLFNILTQSNISEDKNEITFCSDLITTNDNSFGTQTYIVTLTSPSDGFGKLKLERAASGCNSNHGGAHGQCGEYDIDQKYQFKNIENVETQNMTFELCRKGVKRSVECKGESDSFSCTFNKPGSGSFETESLCIDFYDKDFKHTAYLFKDIKKSDKTTWSTKDGKITRCPSNRCNSDWTGCSVK